MNIYELYNISSQKNIIHPIHHLYINKHDHHFYKIMDEYHRTHNHEELNYTIKTPYYYKYNDEFLNYIKNLIDYYPNKYIYDLMIYIFTINHNHKNKYQNH